MYARCFLLDKTVTDLITEMCLWLEKRGIEPLITETLTNELEDEVWGRVSDSHRTGRAVDFSVRGWSKMDELDFKAHFVKERGHLGALNSKGRPNLIVFHDNGNGYHVHVQVNRMFTIRRVKL
jgi:hypothetical protein